MPLKIGAGFLLLVAAAAGQVPFKQIPHGPAADGFKFLYTLPLPQREYRGTVDGFAAALPAYFQRAATVAGFADRDYSKEIAFIIDAVKTCGQITPQMAASVFEPNGKTVWRKPDGVERLEKLGPQYQVCEVKNGLPVPPQVTGVRGLGLRIEPWGTYKLGNGLSQWQEGKGFIAQILFGQVKGDETDIRGGKAYPIRLQPTFDYTVIHALLPIGGEPASTGQQGAAAPVVPPPVVPAAAPAPVIAAAPTMATPGKRPGLEAQVVNLGRAGPVVTALTASVRILNNSADVVYLLLVGEPSAIDDAGGNFSIVFSVTGAAWCPGPQSNPPSYRLCVGQPRVDDHLYPLQGYTEIGPGDAITVNYVFHGGGNKGKKYSLAQEVAFRVAKSADDDAALSDEQKLRRLHFGSLNFNQVEAPPKEVVTSRISFAEVK